MSQQLQPSTHHSLVYHSQQQEFVTMCLGGQLFGISVASVQDVLRKQVVTPVPLAPSIVAGSLNLRGRIVTAIDMRRRLGIEAFDDYSKAMHVVVHWHEELFSLVVDSVGEVLTLPTDQFEKTPSNLGNWRDVSSGVYKLEDKLLVILDVSNVLSH